jgi:hypothetical protein
MTDKREDLAKLLHESGREAVEKRLVYRNDLPVKPFCEWNDLTEDAKEGRRLMAQYLLDHTTEVRAIF